VRPRGFLFLPGDMSHGREVLSRLIHGECTRYIVTYDDIPTNIVFNEKRAIAFHPRADMHQTRLLDAAVVTRCLHTMRARCSTALRAESIGNCLFFFHCYSRSKISLACSTASSIRSLEYTECLLSSFRACTNKLSASSLDFGLLTASRLPVRRFRPVITYFIRISRPFRPLVD